MPSNWLSIDNNFPTFTGEESPKQQIAALHNYLYQLREGLQYSLRNLTADNFSPAALASLTESQKNEVTEQLEQVYKLMSQLSAEVDLLSGRIGDAELLSRRVSELEQTVTGKDGLQEKVENLDTAVTGEDGLQKQVEALDTAVTGEGGLQAQVAALDTAVTGEGGLQEQVTGIKQAQEKTGTAVAVAEDGSVAIGSQGKRVDLVGDIYINGVLYTQEETQQGETQ